jgi:hypothetical protein
LKVLNVSQSDWANFAYTNSQALRSVGVECDSISATKHNHYLVQSETIPDITEMIDRIKQYDVVQFFHDNTRLFNLIATHCNDKRIIVWHTSSVYRKYHASINAVMNKYNVIHVCAMPEFMAMCPGAHYVVGAVDTDKLIPTKTNNAKVKFAHYPSNPTVKGTPKIWELMRGLDVDFTCSIELVNNDMQLKRISECDVYIEMFTERDGNGSLYGNFGITALEAAAMGKAVITNCKDRRVYYENYGKLPFIVVNDEKTFIHQVLLMNTGVDITDETRDIIVKNHSYQSTGNRILKLLLQYDA